MELYAYCFMPIHIHVIFRSAVEDLSDLLSDFKKKYTSKNVIKVIEENPQESRKKWVFKRAGKKKGNVSTHMVLKTGTTVFFG
ncbi:hypothetical protein D9V96_020380 [Zobellia laminariae]|uniref:hypothetical protein n=1 Tax=Zobellia laminariae TaxID=248906 RepID=UPI0040565ECA